MTRSYGLNGHSWLCLRRGHSTKRGSAPAVRGARRLLHFGESGSRGERVRGEKGRAPLFTLYPRANIISSKSHLLRHGTQALNVVELSSAVVHGHACRAVSLPRELLFFYEHDCVAAARACALHLVVGGVTRWAAQVVCFCRPRQARRRPPRDLRSVGVERIATAERSLR